MENNELNTKLKVTEDNIEHMLNGLEEYSGLEVKDIGLMRNEKGKLQVIILMWRGKGAKAKES